MATKTLSEIIGGGGFPIRLAVDTTFFTDKVSGVFNKRITGIDASAALTEVLGLTGRFIVYSLTLTGLIANDLTDIRLTVDGVNIWDENSITVSATVEPLLGEIASAGVEGFFEPMLVQTDFSLKVKMATDTAIGIDYAARPIL